MGLLGNHFDSRARGPRRAQALGLVIGLFFAGWAPLTLAEQVPLGEQTVSGRIFPIVGAGKLDDLSKSPAGEPAYLYETWIRKTPTGRIQTNLMHDRVNKQTAVVETIEIQSGPDGKDRVKAYRQEQNQLQAFGRIEVTDSELKFEYTRDGKTKSAAEKKTNDFVVTATLPLFIAEKWSELLDGKTVSIRLGVVDRLETVGFELTKIDLPSSAHVTIRMRPSSFIIRQLVNPLHLQFDKSSRRLVRLDGRSLIKRRESPSSKWSDFDVTTLYQQVSVSPETR